MDSNLTRTISSSVLIVYLGVVPSPTALSLACNTTTIAFIYTRALATVRALACKQKNKD